MITDGEPTDMQPGDPLWNEVINLVHEGASEANKKFAFYAVGVEPANMAKLKQIAPPDITKGGKLYKFLWRLENKEGAFKDMFGFFSRSLTETAKAVPGIQEPMKVPESMKPT